MKCVNVLYELFIPVDIGSLVNHVALLFSLVYFGKPNAQRYVSKKKNMSFYQTLTSLTDEDGT